MQYKFPCTDNQAIDDLGRQLEKIFRKATRGSIKSRYRYARASARFVKWVQPEFKMQKLANLQDKHLIAYAKNLKSKGKADKHIKNELSALRYMHENTPNSRFELGNSEKVNKEAGLGSTPNNRAAIKNQAWMRDEIERFAEHARTHGRPEIAKMMLITREIGTRLEEISTLRRTQFESALRSGVLHLTNTKGGRPRNIPLSGEARRLLEEAIQGVPRGEYVFILPGTKVHKFMSQCQNYITNNRDKIQDPTRVNDPHRAELHWHGIRHHFAQNYYCELRESGMDDREARIQLAQVLGHGRAEVTYVYVP